MKNAIAKIIEKYPHPDQTLLPKVNLVWYTQKGQMTLECETGVKYENTKFSYDSSVTYRQMRNDEIYVLPGCLLKYAYCKYHEEAKLVEFAVVTMNSNRTGGARLWEYAAEGERYFINKKRQIFTSSGEEKNDRDLFCAYKYHNSWGFYGYIGMVIRCNYNQHFMEEFVKFIGSKTIIVGNGRCLELAYGYHIQEWYRLKNSKRTSGKVQKLLDEVTSLPHKDLSNICEKYGSEIWTSNDRYSSNKTLDDVIYFEKLNDDWSVLRYCFRKDDNDNIESYRVYISEDGNCKMTKLNDDNEWVPAQNLKIGWRSSYGRIVNFDEMSKCKRLSYIMPLIKKMPPHHQLQRIVSIVKFPEIEKLYKMGYEEFANELLTDNTVNANITNRFGKINTKAKTIFGEFGLNKHQFEIYQEKCNHKCTNYYAHNDIDGNYFRSGIIVIKKYFGEDISYMDNETFEKILMCAALVKKNCYRGLDGLIDQIGIDGQRFLKNIARLSMKHENSGQLIRVCRDTMDLYTQIDVVTRPTLDWIFDSYSDIIRVHDALVEIKRIQDEERRARWNMEAAERRKKEDERRKKIDEKRKCYEYEEDKYIIRLPKDCNEIVEEGVKQHICIGGYTSRHSEGNTNLFFLRKKDEPDTPFYAIEMNTNKQIIQIHGFGNKWLGNDPEAIPTVVRWLRKNDIKCDRKILLCISTGYHSDAQYVEMPVVD